MKEAEPWALVGANLGRELRLTRQVEVEEAVVVVGLRVVVEAWEGSVQAPRPELTCPCGGLAAHEVALRMVRDGILQWRGLPALPTAGAGG